MYYISCNSLIFVFLFIQAILGAEIDVLTLDGMVTMKVPPGTQPESQLMLRGKGVRSMNNFRKRGNQIVKLKVTIPKKVTERQKELLREFSGETDTTSGSAGCGKAHGDSIISQAWSRLKDFLGSKDATTNTDSKAQSASTEEGKAKNQAENKA